MGAGAPGAALAWRARPVGCPCATAGVCALCEGRVERANVVAEARPFAAVHSQGAPERLHTQEPVTRFLLHTHSTTTQ